VTGLRVLFATLRPGAERERFGAVIREAGIKLD
jgi:hypothetical protein